MHFAIDGPSATSQALQNARLHGMRIALLTIDLDHFKLIDASVGYGEGEGDRTPQWIAERLRGILPDTFHRQGSDGFMALLPEVCEVDEIHQLCDRVQPIFAEPAMTSQHSFQPKASMGTALDLDDSNGVEQLYSHSHSAMNRAREKGRNCRRFYSRAAGDWQAYGSDIGIGVNVSPRQSAESTFADSVSEILERMELLAELMQLEITEGICVNELEQHRSGVDRLKDSGVLIAIDDFGSGYASLNYLKRGPADIVKIDQSCAHKLLTDSSDGGIVHPAYGSGLQVVAEGAGKASQGEMLKAMGCQVAQGFLHGRPMPLAPFHQLLARQRS